MINIILYSEQERLLQEQLKTGKYTTPDEVITEALKALAEKQQGDNPLTEEEIAEEIAAYRRGE